MKRSRRQRGSVVLGFVGVGLMAFLGMAVVGIDFGHIGLTANEVQTVADVAATSGARSLLKNFGGASEDPVAVAQATVAENLVDGGTASIDAADVEVGTWSFQTGTFSAGGVSPNAVRATGRATVPNMVAGIYGDGTTDMVRQAIAAFSGNASGNPVCPVTTSVCHFEEYQASDDCSDLPVLSEVPNGVDTAGFTSLGPSPASAAQAIAYLPPECGGGGETPPTVRIGDMINVVNGQVNTILHTMRECFEEGYLTECILPLVDMPCDEQFNQAKPVVAFATMRIERIVSTGNPKGIDLSGICYSDAPGAPGGPNFGTLSVSMVN